MPKKLVLIVEDDESILFNLKLSLEMNEFDVVTATNGLNALDLIKSTNNIPDIILSDIMMPKMNGYDFLKAVSKDEKLKLIPFIFISAKSTPDDINIGRKLGINDYITKPIKEEILLKVIKKNLEIID